MYGDKRGLLWLLNNGWGFRASILYTAAQYNIVLRLVMSAIIIPHDESEDYDFFIPGTLLPPSLSRDAAFPVFRIKLLEHHWSGV